jgi:hypothetical protein
MQALSLSQTQVIGQANEISHPTEYILGFIQDTINLEQR